MIYAIEGTDKVGKSTLANILSSRTSMPLIKMKVDKETFEQSIEKASYIFNTTVSQFKNHDFILDRCYISSLVYHQAFDRQDDISYIDDLILEWYDNFQLIYLFASDQKTLVERQYQESLIPAEKLETVNQVYNEMITQAMIDKTFSKETWAYDTTQMTPQEIAQDIMKRMKR